MKISKNTWIATIIMVLIVSVGVFLYASANNGDVTSSTEQTQTEQIASSIIIFNEDGTVVSHDGLEGEIALATLKSLTDVRTEDSAYGEFVVGIGEIDADSSVNFWGFYINGEMATVGAGDYVAKEGDQIEWQLTELN